MPIDPARYPLITAEYRYATVYLSGIAALYGKARTLELPSNFRTMAGLPAIASAIADVIGVPNKRMEFIISGTDVISPDTFKTKTPTIQLSCSDFDIVNKLFIVTRLVINDEEDFTALELLGGV